MKISQQLLFALLLSLTSGLTACDKGKQSSSPPQKDNATTNDSASARGSAGAALPSWKEGKNKARIVQFVQEITNPSSPNFVAPEDRIAVFDNDGTLWAEQPFYFPLVFAIDRIQAQIDEHPEWRKIPNVNLVVKEGIAAFDKIKSENWNDVLILAFAGMSEAEYEEALTKWLATARHPRFDAPYTSLTYQPMVELVDYLQQQGFRVFIVSGGEIDFIRGISEAQYGVPKHQVVGSSIGYEYTETPFPNEIQRKAPFIWFNNRKEKVVNIQRFIGRRPIIAIGNSDGDLDMLNYTASGQGPSLSMVVFHDDEERAYDYDKGAKDVLKVANEKDWAILSIKNDFAQVYSGSPTSSSSESSTSTSTVAPKETAKGAPQGAK